MAYTQVNTTWTRSVFAKRIQNYGCHCFPKFGRKAGGQGPSLDGYDDLCRILARCHKCVEMDHSDKIGKDFNADIDGKNRFEKI